ncbi:hypothetical protein [Aeromicrobium sp. HA]|uniref:hypothetical protein n=1 Tax=Aeromicrobium sp. HA TaxID=3009077 RepID=UPI0022AE8BF3|nr:hypothetical protein [Aeromicrobium sp. HA]
MTQDSTTPMPATTTNASRGRTAGAVVCLVLAALLTTPAAIAYWGQRTLNDGERYVETVGPLVQSPEIQEVLATRVTTAISQQVDIEGLLDQAFAGLSDEAPRLELLAAPLSAAINAAIDRQVRAFLASDAFADLWTRLNVRAQQAFQRILEGRGGGAVSLQGDDVVLDVGEVIDEVKARLVDRGMTFVENAPIPETDRTIVLMEAPRVQQIRTIYAFSDPVARWALPVVGVLYLGAVLLARRRPRMTVAVGIAIAVNAVVLAIALGVGRQLFSNALAETSFGPASTVFYETLSAYLERGRQVVLMLGLALVVAGWFTGSNRSGTAVRTAIGGALERFGAGVVHGQLGLGWRWVTDNVAWLRVVAVGVAVVVLAWGNEISPERWWWSLALALVLLAVLQVLAGAGRAVSPAASRDHAPTAHA